jgi:hypothetical protein
MANSRGRASVRIRAMTSDGTLPSPTPDMVMAVLRRIPAARLVVGPAIEPIWTNRVAW